MSDELDLDIIKRTQSTLGKYVKKPNLSEKLLKKPPFRFLYDVFIAIIRDTKCFVGLYTLEELTYENIKGRDDKMRFLQKMIDVVKLATGSTLPIKTSKIVAGHEPDKTNELLQLMGKIIENKLDWERAVEQVSSGKTARKESPRKRKDTSNKETKDIKCKEKSKEKESRNRESKITKASSNKITTTTSKDDKTKINKSKDKITGKLTTKEKASKGSKEVQNPVKKQSGDVPKKPKLNKTETQSIPKSPTSNNTQEPTKKLKSIINETERNHEQMEQQNEKEKTIAPIRKVSNNIESNHFIDHQQDPLQLSNVEVRSLSDEKSEISSAKTPKLSETKPEEGFREIFDDKERKSNLQMSKSLMPEQEKSEISDADANASLKQNSFSSTTNHEQQHIQTLSESSETLNRNQQESFTSTPQNSQPLNLNKEMKRESTFTRENSKESNNSSLVNRTRTSLRPPSARPPSARPGAPRRRDKNIEIILQPNDQIKMSGIQVKLETFGDLNDDGENLVIIENPNANDVAIVNQSDLTESENMIQNEALEQGHLVQQILETQKELVQQQTDESSLQKNYKDSTNNSVMRQTSARHMNNLRDVIQNLTKSVNPLGKLMDFIPEDIDAMQLEFTLWRDAYTQAANELKREKSLTESAIEPMKIQLVQIEANIVEYMEMINASRVKILQNSEKIIKLLTTS